MKDDQPTRYWKHIRKLAHLGLPTEARINIDGPDPFKITAEKSATETVLKITLDTGERRFATMSTKELLNALSNYRRTAKLSKSESYTFDIFTAEEIFNLRSHQKSLDGADAEQEKTLSLMIQEAMSLSDARLKTTERTCFSSTRRPLRILVASMRSYPYGGGEAWIIESSLWLQEQGHHVILINFKEPDWSLIPFNSCHLVKGIPRIGIKMADTDLNVMYQFQEAIKLYVPDIIHTQGEINSILNQNYDPSWPPLVCGYHFWNGIINLGRMGNKKILSNSRNISIDNKFGKNFAYPRYFPYIVSPFMKEVLKNAGFHGDVRIVSPAEKKEWIEDPSDPSLCSYDFLQLNCSILKGGISFIRLATRMNDRRFYGLCALWEEITQLYEKAIDGGLDVQLREDRLEINNKSWITCTWVDNVSEIILNSKVLLSLSLVDETYGRVIPEAIELGRPVIASPNGNHKYILSNKYMADPEDISKLETMASELVTSNSSWISAIKEQRQHLKENTSCGKKDFTRLIENISASCFHNHVAIIAPWSEQGLGYHAKTYADALRVSGIEPHIYSFQPYAADNIGLAIQSSTAEWESYDVHYSYNHRESLTAREIHQFCMHKNCKVILALEICWEVNWVRLMELTTLGLDVVLVPNPETIRKSEIYFHQNFPRVLCTTRLAEKILNKNNISNTFWIGHGYGNEISQENRNRRIDLLSEYARNGEVILTHIAGYNHKRKMTCEIIKSLAPVLRELPGFKLRILSQIPFEPDCYKYASNISNLEMVNGFLSHNDVMDEYRNASFSLQLSTHEGLGLGFYESISCGTPVITIDKEPHNEAIIDGHTGILIKARDMTLYDNDDALIKGGIFNSEDLAMVITKLTPELALELSRTCMAKHKSDLSLQALSTRMTAGLQPFI